MRAANAAVPRGEQPPEMTETGIGSVGAAHVPVMVAEVVAWLRPRPGARLVDATVGLGGHAAALLAAAPETTLLGVDRDAEALEQARLRLELFGDRVVLRRAAFAELGAVMAELAWAGADGILLDLGVSSLQLDTARRGFSFQADGPLDMRMDAGTGLTAATVVNEWTERDLAAIVAAYGEEPRARAIARAIVRARPLATTGALAAVVRRVVGSGRPGIDPATRVFQAIRIAVNDEIGLLDRFLADGYGLLQPGGRMAVLAYHSLEDRPVKAAFRRWAAACICPPHLPRCACGWSAKTRALTPRPARPTPEEVAHNPRARSARLRVAERLGAAR